MSRPVGLRRRTVAVGAMFLMMVALMMAESTAFVPSNLLLSPTGEFMGSPLYVSPEQITAAASRRARERFTESLSVRLSEWYRY